jgi:hypothetical protein
MARRANALLRLLGYENCPTFFTSVDQPQSSHIIREALSTIGIRGIFALVDGFQPSSLKPIVYVACAEDADELRVLRKGVWSQGAVPFLIVIMPNTVEICHGFEPPSAPTLSVDYDSRAAELPEELKSFAADEISSSITWRDFEIHRDSSVDNNLVDAIEALNDLARAKFSSFKHERSLVNSLIGKFIYIYVLVDRQILSEKWLSSRLTAGVRAAARPFLEAIISSEIKDSTNWTAQAALSVFDVVDDAINGSVFGLSEEQRARIPDALCHFIHRVVRCGEILLREGSQLGFFNVSFSVLRTETISAIYERFISIEDWESKRDDGVYYTPPHLADHVLDRLEATVPITSTSRVIDPAAGSGIFLVGAFRRLMERNAPVDGWQPRHINRAKSLLLNTIHGMEKHAQAANVCRFSLYLTLLDYVGRAPIEELIRAAGQQKFLPDLSDNIRSIDAFLEPASPKKFTHVVGNPPWPTVTGQKDRTNQNSNKREEGDALLEFADELKEAKLYFGQNRLSDLFMWLAVKRLAADGEAIALVLPARSLIGRSASKFAHCLARNVTVKWVGNLSHLRRKLFDGVEAPACVVVAINRRPTHIDKAEIYRPLLSSLPGGRKNEIWSLFSSTTEIRAIRSQDLQAGPNGWFVQAMLSELDRRLHEALRTWSVVNRRTLGDFLQRSGLLISKGGSFAETGIRRRSDQGRDAQIHSLNRADLTRVNPDFRGWFSGNVILIPRSLNEATYHRHPVAYPSTFNAVIPKDQYVDSIDGVLSEREMRYLPGRFVTGFLRYINSDVVKYFASLFGASYLIDKARIEKNDLLALPCPFNDLHDPQLLALGSSSDSDADILSAMNAGADFRSAFNEFSGFRKYFANAQIPPDSLASPTQRTQQRYLQRLKAELESSFGIESSMRASIERASSHQTYVRVSFGKRSGTVRVDVKRQFLSGSIVVYDRQTDSSVIVKSPTKAAWTIDQAVTDALALSSEMRGSG